MSMIVALTLFAGVYCAGNIVARLTRGRIGSALFCVPVMLLLFWSGIITKADVDTSQLPAVYAIMTALILVNVGTTFELRGLRKEWRLLVVCLASLAGAALVELTLGTLLFGHDLAFYSYPIMAGGMVATMLMQQTAVANDLSQLAAIVLLVLTVSMWVSMPVISNALRLECRRLLDEKRRDPSQGPSPAKTSSAVVGTPAMQSEAAARKVKLIDRLPAQLDSDILQFFLCCFFSMIAALIAGVTGPKTGGILGTALVGIIVGTLARELGLISRDPLTKAHLTPFFMFAMIISMFASFGDLTPKALLGAILPLLGVIALFAIGLSLVAVVIGKMVGFSVPLSICIAFQCFCGYPLNYQIALETFEVMAEDQEEMEYLKDQLLDKVILGGVITVSIASVIIAAVFMSIL